MLSLFIGIISLVNGPSTWQIEASLMVCLSQSSLICMMLSTEMNSTTLLVMMAGPGPVDMMHQWLRKYNSIHSYFVKMACTFFRCLSIISLPWLRYYPIIMVSTVAAGRIQSVRQCVIHHWKADPFSILMVFEEF